MAYFCTLKMNNMRMEPVKVFSGDEVKAGAVQHLLNTHSIGTWVRTTRLKEGANDEDAFSAIEIFIEAEHEAKARLVMATQRI